MTKTRSVCVSRLLSHRKKRAGCSALGKQPVPHCYRHGEKMAALLLLSLGALFFLTNAQDAYNELPETYRKGVDLALEKINSYAGLQHHFLFFRSVTKSDIEVLYYCT